MQAPLFAFGHGLSYTNFAYSGFSAHISAGVHLSAKVKNIGDRSGGDVVQFYLTKRNGENLKRLVGFERVELLSGEEKAVEVKVDPRLLANFDTARNKWVIPAGEYIFSIAYASDQLAESQLVALPSSELAP